MSAFNAGRYDALEPLPPVPHTPSVERLPMEDLDFDTPPQGQLPPGARAPFYRNQFGGPDVRHSFADSTVSSRQPSENPSYTALPVDRSSGYDPSPLNPYYDDPSQANISQNAPRDYGTPPLLHEKRNMYNNAGKSRKKTWIILGVLGLVLVAAAVGLGIYFGAVRPKQNEKSGDGDLDTSTDSGSSKGNNSGGSQKPIANLVVSGGDGSKITTEDGSSFTYKNPMGGTWYYDPNNPYANHAQAQNYTPPLNQTWKWGVDKIYGVNLGGWLNTEPFISPALYEQYNGNAVDEWTLSESMRADTANGGISQLEKHYQTFVTEQDFAEIAGAGLNWIRIPIPFWAIETRDDEPFLEGVAWKYFLKAIEWARKYGLRINIDLHALPGSQNGWNHSGRLGDINVLNGVMGIANAQRSLTYIRIIAEFISQPQYKDVVPFFGVINEPQASVIGLANLQSFYVEIYETIRNIGGVGEGNGPVISYHDGFMSLKNWAGWLPNADRVAMDTHPYFAFGGQSSSPISSFGPQACSAWGPMMNDSWTNIGITAAGEFSLATNDCGLFVNGVGLGTRYEGNYTAAPSQPIGSCEQWDDWESWSPDTKAQLMTFAMASMDALQNWFFWTWKIGNSTTYGSVRSPFWSYKLGLEQGWIPTDPRSAAGSCDPVDPYVGPPQPWQTGGAGANQIPATATAQLPFPPAQISAAGDATLLPTFTPTGTVITLSVMTVTASATKTADPGNGWTNKQDTAGAYVPIAGCQYPNAYSGVGAAVPTAACGAGAALAPAVKREPMVTPMPS